MCKHVVLIAALAFCSTGLGAVHPKNSNIGRAEISRVAATQGVNAAFSNGPGGTAHWGSPRGGGGTIHSGIPACDDQGVCDLQVGITGTFNQVCPAGNNGWVSLAFPVQTDGATITAVNMTHNSNANGGHLYLLGDCGGNPDRNNRLYTGCGDIVAGSVGPQVYPIDPPVATGATTWVVAVFTTSFSFDVAYNSSLPGTGLAYGNLVTSGSCGNWDDLNDFGFGFCYCVSVETIGGGEECCDAAQCDGDANGDGIVDPLDTGYILSRFSLDPTVGDNCQADVNCDGVIDPLDSGYALSRFGTCNEPIYCAPGGGDCSPGQEPLENDNCADALTALEGVTSFSNVEATTDGPADCDEFTGNNDIWYNYTATAAGTAVISLCGDTFFDSTLSVYNGFGCPVGAPLGCSDDDCGIGGGPSELSVSVTNGQQLKIRVGGWDDGNTGAEPTGSGEMTISLVPTGQGACCFPDESCTLNTSSDCTNAGGVFEGAGTACTVNQCLIASENDVCANVIPVTVPEGQTVTLNGDNSAAVEDDCIDFDQNEVWEAFTIETALDVTVDYCGTGATFSPVWGFITDGCPCGPNFIEAPIFAFGVCDNGETQPIMTFTGLAAGTYYIPVYAGDDALLGPYTINVSAIVPAADCCAVHPQPGCDEICGTPVGSQVEDCVCAFDPVCCSTTWDEACVAGVEAFGCGDCSVCIPPTNCCDTGHGAGCDDAVCEALVCGFDPFCCDVDWDALCVGESETCCEVCGGDPSDPSCAPSPNCGPPNTNDCCSANTTPGCSDEFCCLSICPVDPFCCDTAWDQDCANTAATLCDNCL